MLQTGITTEWLLEGFKYELASTYRPATVEYYCGEIRRFLRWAIGAGVPSDIRLITKHHIQGFFHFLSTQRGTWGSKSNAEDAERLRWPYYRALRRCFSEVSSATAAGARRARLNNTLSCSLAGKRSCILCQSRRAGKTLGCHESVCVLKEERWLASFTVPSCRA